VADLWAFWQGLPADATPSQPHELGFPFSIRRAVGVWKRLNLNADPVIAVGDDPVLQRGAYLVEALAHCAECHTPRDALGGLNTAAWMAGGPNPSGEGRIPALPPQGWSAQDIANYLQSGFTPSFDVVGGEMADVVANISRIAPEDRTAIAAYVMAVRSSPSP
jgi:mono/diheme cytochrome c family protein